MKVFLTPALLSGTDERALDQILIDALRAEFRKDRAATVGTQAGTGRSSAAPGVTPHVGVERVDRNAIDAASTGSRNHACVETAVVNLADHKGRRPHTEPVGGLARRQRPHNRAERRTPATHRRL